MATTKRVQRQMGSSEDWWNRFRRIEEEAVRSPVVFIVGSALSTAGGQGVPGTADTVKILLERYPGRGISPEGDTAADRYQSAFAQLPIKVHADAPDEVVRDCVLRASRLPEGDPRLASAHVDRPCPMRSLRGASGPRRAPFWRTWRVVFGRAAQRAGCHPQRR